MNIKRAGAVIYTNESILSEFINARVNMELKVRKKSRSKSYRASENFKEVAKSITDQVEEILSYCRYISTGIQSIPAIRNIMLEYAQGNHDFNDQVITKTCQTHGLILVTDDSDFANSGVQILTANENMLPQRRR